jgi:peptide/nickel transport system substrate-binding protein
MRKAIAHAIDKREPFEVVTLGKGILSDTFTHPRAEYHAQVDREITKYPHDPRRAQQLLEEMGYTRSGGQWMTPRGEPAELPIWVTGGAALFEQENTIMVAQLKQFGIAAESKLFPSGGSREDRALSPGIIGGSGGSVDEFSTQEIPTPATRWAGGNRGAYSNPEMDRLITAFAGAVDLSERVRLIIQMEKIASDELPAIFLYFHSRAWNHVANLKGPKVRQVADSATPFRNIHEWEWIS